MEAAGLGFFMLSACAFGVLLEHPMSPVHQALEQPFIRRLLAGIAMGLTFLAIVCSKWGKRSGAHLNPSVTLTFLVLGKISRVDALFYILFQFLGGLTGVFLAEALIGLPLQHSSVNYSATIPGPQGPGIALWAELFISALMMTVVLNVSNSRRWSRFLPYIAASLVATYIALESPLSGMSMNPARTLGSAIPAREWTALWIYFVAPPLGMLLAAVIHRTRPGAPAVFCAKLHHHNRERCIFRCNYAQLMNGEK